MPIIRKPESDEKKLPWRIRLRESVCHEIEQYCEWANIRYRDYFLEQACLHVFSTDSEWIEHKAKNEVIPSEKTGLSRHDDHTEK